MGLIRKSLALGTLGVVRPNSKKQRVGKAQLKELKKQTAVLQRAEATAAQHEHDQQIAQRQAALRAAPPLAGWYPDADQAHLLRWWDGVAWTDRTAPRV